MYAEQLRGSSVVSSLGVCWAISALPGLNSLRQKSSCGPERRPSDSKPVIYLNLQRLNPRETPHQHSWNFMVSHVKLWQP